MSVALRGLAVALLLLLATVAAAADFGTKGGPAPANLDAFGGILRQDHYSMELLISFGTSKGGSAGHMALAIRGRCRGRHGVLGQLLRRPRARARDGFLCTDLVTMSRRRNTCSRPPRRSPTRPIRPRLRRDLQALGHGRARLRRPAAEKTRLVAYFARINDDYRKRSRNTEYHDGDIVYGYMRPQLRQDHRRRVQVWRRLQGARRQERAAHSVAQSQGGHQVQHTHRHGDEAYRGMERAGLRDAAVLYKKYDGSTYVDPHDAEKVAFKNLPDRFPSVLSLDFLRDQDSTGISITSSPCTSCTTWASTA